MVLSRSDENELLTAIHEGQQETPPWATFLKRLRRRARADLAVLLSGAGGGRLHAWRDGRHDPTPQADHKLVARLRDGRVYTLAELRELTLPEAIAPNSADGRMLRVSEPGGTVLVVAFFRAIGACSAADGSLLVAIAPHLTIALRNLVLLDRERMRASIGERVLGQAGLAWSPCAGTEAALPRRGAAEMRIDGSRPRPRGGGPRLLLPIALDEPAILTPPEGIAVTRTARASGPRRAALLGEAFGLTGSEARLALALADGRSIAETAATLGLTIGTMRNYSKSLYAKMGARGQADLVRRVIGSVAWLA